MFSIPFFFFACRKGQTVRRKKADATTARADHFVVMQRTRNLARGLHFQQAHYRLDHAMAEALAAGV